MSQTNEKLEFTAEQMIEFACWYSNHDITEKELQDYIRHLEEEKEKEYLLYLKLKAKYENGEN